ncbi:acetoacetate--CoA ligase [Fodinicurvata fenggangensis]|uniref:acetoacetate--CoA ligase n=1 Tax=Fodinicurvata fenggangensis TaxID=1121830 RepID=UPI00047AAC57|nr:acetoacetate--CoA ligase [Fodinicurvata fenggangensis]
MAQADSENPLWTPSPEQVRQSNIQAFLTYLAANGGPELADSKALYDWSIENIEDFWLAIWNFCEVIGDGPGEPVLRNGDKMPGAEFFPNARLNFAENLLRRRDDGEAMVFRTEQGGTRRLTFREVHEIVSRLSQALAAEGVGPGDRVAGFLPNMPETVLAMLATASLGAVWSSCSPDFGHQGVLDRFGQIEPKVLFCPDGYYYNGKTLPVLERVRDFAAELPTLSRIVVCPLIGESGGNTGLDKGRWLDDFMAPYEAGEIAYERMPFNAPLYIMFSSGTTGKPKCIVHGAGGTLLQHLKEHQLHSDIKPDDRVFYFTTCGWMMWNWQVSALASKATLLLYDGSPFHPDGNVLFDYMEAEKGTLFGTSAKYIDALKKAGLSPRKTHDLSALRMMASTGSPLVAESFDYVYDEVKADLCLASISGGTDIVSCFVLGDPTQPVWRGEIQTRGFGLAVQVWNEQGQPVVEEKGELVCVKPFPCMPIYFWNDPDGERYRKAYFAQFPGVWCHGDFVKLTRHDGIVVYGRSDATLNPGGVRIGTAEIYRQVEKLPEVLESLVIGQEWDNDTRVVLFVRLSQGVDLDDALVDRIRKTVREGASPRHMPARVVQVDDIPRTKSGKIVELAVRDIVHGRDIKNREALANPEALEEYRGRSELQE